MERRKGSIGADGITTKNHIPILKSFKKKIIKILECGYLWYRDFR